MELTVPSYALASISRRLVALFLDALIIFIPSAVAACIIPFVGGVLVLFLYAPILESSTLRATLGKYLMGVQVVDLEGKRISFQASMIRNIVKVVSSVLLFIGHFFALFTARKQACHDLFAETIVIYGRNEQPIFDAWKESFRKGCRVIGAAFSSDPMAKLERLQRLREQGALTEEEFLIEKKKLFECG